MNYCAIYKTRRKSGLYLFVKEQNQFDEVPDGLLAQFGKPELAMVLPLNKSQGPFRIDKQELIERLETDGYYLQMPEQESNLLAIHRTTLGLDGTPPKKDF